MISRRARPSDGWSTIALQSSATWAVFAEAIGTAETALIFCGRRASPQRSTVSAQPCNHLLHPWPLQRGVSASYGFSRLFLSRRASADAVLVGIYTGQCQLQLRRFDDVLILAQEAEDQFERCGEQFYVGQARLNEATAYAGLGRSSRRWQPWPTPASALKRSSIRCGPPSPIWRPRKCCGGWAGAREPGPGPPQFRGLFDGDLPVEQAQANLAAARAALAMGAMPMLSA